MKQKTEELADMEGWDNEAVQAYIDLGIEEGEALENFEEAYQGQAPSDEDFVSEMLDSTGDIPKDFPPYIHIDWERTARDIMMDYSEQDGHYFRNL